MITLAVKLFFYWGLILFKYFIPGTRDCSGGRIRVNFNVGQERVGQTQKKLKRLPPNCLFSVQVTNTGDSIPPAAREHIFELFYRVDESRSSESGGRGVGLALTAEILARHHAQIQLLPPDSAGENIFEILFYEEA